ncbi:MAG: RidA family protein [Arenibacterium sp.]
MSITRKHTGQRMSQIVQHGGTIYLAGQVGTLDASVAQQTQDCLDKIDALLAEVGSDKTKLLQAVIWLADMSDFEEMNAVWDAWVPEGHAPARACGEAKLARPGFTVEIIVTAAA